MAGKQKPETTPNVVPDALISVGKDEMNLIEFPLSSICRRRSNAEKTFVLERQQREKGTGEVVTRRVVVTGSDAYGLLQPVDDVVIIGLISLTMWQAHAHGELSRKVYFSRYGLCQELNWATDGRYYRKLEASLDRISGVRIKTTRAWYDKGEREWKSHNFGIIDNYELCDKARYDRKRAKGQLEFPMCYFIWNEVPWKSFSDGYVKTIDMNLFRAVNRSAVALRLYRITDKRFYHGDEFRIPLKKLAWEHLALSEHYAPSQMMREIDRGYERLAEEGYLVDINREERYTKSEDGQYWVFFARKERSKLKSVVTDVKCLEASQHGQIQVDTLENELVKRGVNPGRTKPTCAASLVGAYPGEKVKRCISHFDKLNAEARLDRERKSVGWLIASIQSDAERGFAPDEFKTPEEMKKEREQRQRKRERQRERRLAAEEAERKKEQEARARFERLRNSCDVDEQRRLEDDALEQVNNEFLAKSCLRERRKGVIGLWHQMLWERYIIPKRFVEQLIVTQEAGRVESRSARSSKS